MKDNVKNYTVEMMSFYLMVSKSGYYKWLKTQNLAKTTYIKLDHEIKKNFKKSFKTYGSPRLTKELIQNGIECSKTTVARRMKVLNLVARPKRKYVNTTDSDHDFKISDNLLDRKFEVEKINKVWVSDITYIRVASSWMYLTTVIDLADRMVVGWSLSKDMTTRNTVIKAFMNAIANRGIKAGSNLMIHSDRGVQYASREFRTFINQYNCVQSMSRKGNCWDNAVAESFFKTIKVEALNRYSFKESITLNKVVFRYIDGFYNTVRIHSSLGGLSPLQVYKKKYAKQAA